MSYLLRGFLLFTCFLCLAARALDAQQPSVDPISGSRAHGASLTITGSNFGSLSLSEIVLWENFDRGSDSTPLSGSPLIGSWTLHNSPLATYSSTAHRGRSSHCTSTSGGSHCQFVTSLPHNRTRFYGSFWYRYHYPAGGTGQTKILQLWGTEPHVHDYDPGIMAGGFSGGWFASYYVTDSGQPSGAASDWPQTPSLDNWHHFELILEQSGDAVANGSITLKNDNTVIYQRTNIATRTGATQFWDQLHFFYGFTNFASGQLLEHFVDDAYLASSWSRVEIGNAATYSGSSIREVQIPSSWLSGSIQISLNQGSLPSGTPVYLYVTNSDGLVNQIGTPITFQDETDAVAPGAPAGLRITENP